MFTAILAMREVAYGVTIYSEVQELPRPKAASLWAVCVTLDPLEDAGRVEAGPAGT